ncbi:MAG: threonine--tRNA ligase, partial [Candidatus Omnitrophica bacterium]|nr:threonine--tRNA ligase [Candidatus Omnitrophota bacterium]
MDQQQLDALRHSCSHVMAQAVKDLWPEVKLAIGPSIENGFYYDFDKKEPFTPEDLKSITRRMRQIIQEKFEFKKSVMPKSEAINFFKDKGEIYKVEMIEALTDKDVSIYTTGGSFVDLCKGP